MGESNRRRQRAIGEHIGLRPGEPMVLKFFGWDAILDLARRSPGVSMRRLKSRWLLCGPPRRVYVGQSASLRDLPRPDC
jgi:hypothetical protein